MNKYNTRPYTDPGTEQGHYWQTGETQPKPMRQLRDQGQRCSQHVGKLGEA